MGIGGMGIWQLLIILVIVILLFGTKRLGSIGSDLGNAIKGFKKSVKDDDEKTSEEDEEQTGETDARRNVEDGTDKARTEKSDSEQKTRP